MVEIAIDYFLDVPGALDESTPEGKIILQGNSKDPGIKKVCIDCHTNIKDRDYIFSNILIMIIHLMKIWMELMFFGPVLSILCESLIY